MSQVRMSLQEAADALGIAPNSVRSRFKAGKIMGERDNAGKIFVWLDTDKAANEKGSKPDISKPSIEPTSKASNDFEIKALQAHLETVTQQLFRANSELDELRPKAERLARAEAEIAGLQSQLDIRAEQLSELRDLMAKAAERNEAELRRWIEQQPAKGFFARLFGR